MVKGRGMKGQFIFEFLIAGIVFFSVVLFTINFLNANVADFKNQFYIDQLHVMTIRASDLLTNDQSELSIVSSWPEFDTAKITQLSANCASSAYYNALVEQLGLVELTSFGVRRHEVSIRISKLDGTVLGGCGPSIPSYLSKAEIKRFGVLDTGELAELGVVIW